MSIGGLVGVPSAAGRSGSVTASHGPAQEGFHSFYVPRVRPIRRRRSRASRREGAIEPRAPTPPPPSAPAPGGISGDTEPFGATHRQLFETRLHPKPEDERAALAKTAEDPELSALCFDPVPAVIHEVLLVPDQLRAGSGTMKRHCTESSVVVFATMV